MARTRRTAVAHAGHAGLRPPELLFLSMMFHDLGKGYGGDHDDAAPSWSRDRARLRLHFDDRESLDSGAHHLMMSALAQTLTSRTTSSSVVRPTADPAN